MNNHSIPSTHAERKITNLSDYHSFTPYPSLSPYSPIDGITEEQIHSLRMGWKNFFPDLLLCQFFVLAGNRFRFYILTYLEYNTVVALCYFFWFWWEIGFGVMYVLSVQYSCAVVSVFWLWREIVLKMKTPFEFLLGYFIMIR